MRTISTILLACLALTLTGCIEEETKSSADANQAKATARLAAEADRQVGMPNIVNFQERKLMRQIMELRDKENLVTYAYIVDWQGNLHHIGQCVGFGLPYSVQFTNPERIAHQKDLNGGSFGTMPQPEANGLFMPEGLSATWLMMLDPDSGEVRPVYVEPQIIVSPFPLH